MFTIEATIDCYYRYLNLYYHPDSNDFREYEPSRYFTSRAEAESWIDDANAALIRDWEGAISAGFALERDTYEDTGEDVSPPVKAARAVIIDHEAAAAEAEAWFSSAR